jgi:shikimate kinase
MPQSLTPGEFDAHLASQTLRLAFVGMSNGGKSYRSRVFHEEEGFLWYQVDEEIGKALSLPDSESMSAWLGYPTDEGYSGREAQYLELESRFTKNAAQQVHGTNFVFDTTGSVVHLEREALAVLKDNTLVVHLDVGEKSIPEMLERFFAEPKPVAWSGYFEAREGESVETSLKRSYPRLLHERLIRYRELAHVNIPAHELRDATGAETLLVIRGYLV